ncbi:hypothetical protein A8L45_18245 [Veronia pacifica]|uniref:Peptidase M12B domain-containing protein n=1 Tax=Veronia pacifica TaxID=1080227 RepID=A0A1C3ED20_9GAMM|nr:hypothetical protein A8L45_18245 [Veronia pacifica]
MEGDLNYPSCEFKKILETEVHLYISKSVLKDLSRDDVKTEIYTWQENANTVLQNSCIPMRRKVTVISYVKPIDSSWFTESQVDNTVLLIEMENNIEYQDIDAAGVPIFNGIIFGRFENGFKSEFCGFASASSNHFVARLKCDDDVMEHEIGHLSGANHDHKTLIEINQFTSINAFKAQRGQPIKPYSFGKVCAGRGTIMTYEPNIIHAYSNPDITFDGHRCGNPHHADNARVLREFAELYLAKN